MKMKTFDGHKSKILNVTQFELKHKVAGPASMWFGFQRMYLKSAYQKLTHTKW